MPRAYLVGQQPAVEGPKPRVSDSQRATHPRDSPVQRKREVAKIYDRFVPYSPLALGKFNRAGRGAFLLFRCQALALLLRPKCPLTHLDEFPVFTQMNKLQKAANKNILGLVQRACEGKTHT